MKSKKLPLAFWIFIGLVVGVAAGLVFMVIPGGVDIAKSYVKPWGTIFLNLLKFIVVPIVLRASSPCRTSAKWAPRAARP